MEDIEGGRVFIDGKDVTNLPPKDRKIAMVFQSYALYPTKTVRGNLSFGLKMSKLDNKEINKRVVETANLLQIKELLDRKPSQLSGGQKQRVAIGRALVRDADVYLFDEPLSNLDAKLRAEMRGEIKLLHKKLKKTMIYVTHDQVEAMTMGTKIAVLNKGVISQDDTPQKVYHKPNNMFVAKFLGSPSINFLEATYKEEDNLPFCHLDDVDKTKINLTKYNFYNKPNNNERIIIGLRPEHLTLVEGKDYVNNTLKFKINFVEPLGHSNLIIGNIGEAKFSALLPFNRYDYCVSRDNIVLEYLLDNISLFNKDTGHRI